MSRISTAVILTLLTTNISFSMERHDRNANPFDPYTQAPPHISIPIGPSVPPFYPELLVQKNKSCKHLDKDFFVQIDSKEACRILEKIFAVSGKTNWTQAIASDYPTDWAQIQTDSDLKSFLQTIYALWPNIENVSFDNHNKDEQRGIIIRCNNENTQQLITDLEKNAYTTKIISCELRQQLLEAEQKGLEKGIEIERQQHKSFVFAPFTYYLAGAITILLIKNMLINLSDK